MKWWPFGKKKEPEDEPGMEAPEDPIAWIQENLGSHGPKIINLVEPCIRFSSQSAKETEPLKTRIGGDPEVPEGFSWPIWKDEPLGFLAQFNLGELPKVEGSNLPTHGLLSIFNNQEAWGFEPSDRGSTQVFWFEDLDKLSRTTPPKDVPDDSIFPETVLSPRVDRSIPDPNLLCMEDLDLPGDVQDQMFELLESLQGDESGPKHQLLGHPNLIQNEMQKECQLTSNGIYTGDSLYTDDPKYKELLGGKEREWMLLAQIDSDDHAELMFGDVGTLYVWIRKQDLIERRFENCWTILQCS